MQTKSLFLLPGAIALLLAATPIYPSLAQTPTQGTTPQMGQKQKRGERWVQLDLTDAQKTQLQQIKASTRQQMEAVLTPEQKAQLLQAKRNRQRPNLNLSDAQKSQMQSIYENSMRQMNAVLTPEQQQKLQALRQQWQQKRQGQ
jgi:periplasmic protein CpxP/Spy